MQFGKSIKSLPASLQTFLTQVARGGDELLPQNVTRSGLILFETFIRKEHLFFLLFLKEE